MQVDVIELKKRMLESNLEKICDLSEASQVSRPTITNILLERAVPSSAVICKLAITLNLSSDEIGRIFFPVQYEKNN